MLKNTTRAAVVYETFAINPDGTETRLRAPKRNLILDAGLDAIAGLTWQACFTRAVVGTATNPTKRDSGVTTFSLAGNVITASANFFTSGDVGRLFKFDSGEEVYITNFNDEQHVACVYAGSVSSSQGTIWYVNDTGLGAEVKRTNTYGSGPSDNGFAYAAGVFTLKRTFLFSVESAPITYNEIGWSWTSSAGNNLFGRDVISGGDTVAAGQQYKVVVRLIVTVSPIASTAVANVGSGGFNTAGNLAIETNGSDGQFTPIQVVATNGGAGGSTSGVLEPSFSNYIRAIGADFTLSPDSNSPVTRSDRGGADLIPGSYSNGTFTIKKNAHFGVSEVNGALYGLSIAEGNAVAGLTLKFTAPQTKDSSHTLDVETSLSWQRDLVN